MVQQIRLSQGFVALIDDTDGDLAAVKWTADVNPSGHVYAFRRGPRPAQKKIYLHRVILARILGRALAPGEETDHRLGDTLDNRRSELRVADRLRNGSNLRRRINNTSGRTGVCWDKRDQRWVAKISVKRRHIHLGSFTSFDEAVECRRTGEQLYFGEFCRSENASEGQRP